MNLSFKWKSEDMDTLKIGDWRYGKGGMTYQEVVERFDCLHIQIFLEVMIIVR